MGDEETRNFTGFILEVLCPLECGEPLGDLKQVSNVIGFMFRRNPLIAVQGTDSKESFPKYRKMGSEAVAVVQVGENEAQTQRSESGEERNPLRHG